MKYHLHLHQYVYKKISVAVYVPNAKQVQQVYKQEKEEDENAIFPYWSKIWASAFALAEFLIDNPEYITHKVVYELAAGLALPSLVAANYASAVYITDHAGDAIEIVKHSAAHNGFTNVTAAIIDWKHLPSTLNADVVLMSDVNYQPENFESLHSVINNLLKNGSTIILSTPQRLMAKRFIEKLLPYTIQQENINVIEDSSTVNTTVFVLRKTK